MLGLRSGLTVAYRVRARSRTALTDNRSYVTGLLGWLSVAHDDYPKSVFLVVASPDSPASPVRRVDVRPDWADASRRCSSLARLASSDAASGAGAGAVMGADELGIFGLEKLHMVSP